VVDDRQRVLQVADLLLDGGYPSRDTGHTLGYLLIEQVLARGDRVAATARRPEVLADLSAQYGDRLWTARLDVTDSGQAREVVADAFATMSPIDVMVSNAGYGVLGSVEEVSDEQLRRVIDTNPLGSVNVIRAALPFLRKQGHGRILQVSAAGGQARPPVLRGLRRIQVGHRGLLRDRRPGTGAAGDRGDHRRAGGDPDRLRRRRRHRAGHGRLRRHARR